MSFSAHSQSFSRKLKKKSDHIQCEYGDSKLYKKMNDALGHGFISDDEACSNEEFEKDPCTTCAEKEPSLNKGLTWIRKTFMSDKNMEVRMLRAKKKLWDRKLQQVFHNTLFYDAVTKDPTLKGMVGGVDGAKNKVIGLRQCSFAAMEKNWQDALNGNLDHIKNKDIDLKKANNINSKCRKNKTLAQNRFKTFFEGKTIAEVLEKYKKPLTDLSYNELVDAGNLKKENICLPYKSFIQMNAIPRDLKRYIADGKSKDETISKFRDDIFTLEHKVRSYQFYKPEMGNERTRFDIKYIAELELRKKQHEYEKYISFVVSNPILSYLETTEKVKSNIDPFKQEVINKAKTMTDNDFEKFLSSNSSLLDKTMSEQNKDCTNLFSLVLPEILCADEVEPTKEVLANADFSDFHERDKRTFMMTLLCEKKKPGKEWGYKPGASDNEFNGLDDIQSPLEGAQVFATGISDEKINNNKVQANNSYEQANKAYCSLMKGCQPNKKGETPPYCSNYDQLKGHFASTASSMEQSSKIMGFESNPEDVDLYKDFAFYYDRVGKSIEEDPNANPYAKQLQETKNLLASDGVDDKYGGDISVFTNYMVNADQKTYTDFANFDSNPTSNKGISTSPPPTWSPVAKNETETPVPSVQPSIIGGGNNNFVAQNPRNTPSNTQTPEKNSDNLPSNNFVPKSVQTNSFIPTNTTTTTKTSNLSDPIAQNEPEKKSAPDDLDAYNKKIQDLRNQIRDLNTPSKNSYKPTNGPEEENYVQNPTPSKKLSTPANNYNNNWPNNYPKYVGPEQSPRNGFKYPNKDNVDYASSKKVEDKGAQTRGPASAQNGGKDSSKGGSAIGTALGLGDGLRGSLGANGEWIETNQEKLVPHFLIHEYTVKGVVQHLGLEGRRFRTIEHTPIGAILRTYDISEKIVKYTPRNEFETLVNQLKDMISGTKNNAEKLAEMKVSLDKVADATVYIEERLVKDQDEINYLIDQTYTQGEIMYLIEKAMRDLM